MRRRPQKFNVPEPAARLRLWPSPGLTFEEWCEARHEWACANGWIGGAVQLMREEVAVRRGRPMPAPEYPEWCPVGNSQR